MQIDRMLKREGVSRPWYIFPVLFIMMGFLFSCENEFDRYYFGQKDKGLSKSIIETLHEDSEFSDFAALVDKSGIGSLLQKGAVYTVFAPTNAAIREYNSSHPGQSIEAMDSISLRNFVNYHIVFGIFYKYDFGKRYYNSLINRYPTRLYDAQRFQYKQINVFSGYFFGEMGRTDYSEDYRNLYGVNFQLSDSTFNVEGSRVLKSKMDMGCTNGVIHGIDRIMVPRGNLLEVLENDDRFSHYYDFLMRFDTLIYDPANSRIVNGVEERAYKTEFWYTNSSGVRVNLNYSVLDEQVDLTLFPATNDVLDVFFGPFLSNFGGSYNNLPNDIIVDLLRHNLANASVHASRLYVKDMEGGIRMADSRNVLDPGKMLGDESLIASNGIIYPTTSLMTPPRLSSITGRILLDPRFNTMKFLLEQTNYMNTISNSEYVSNDFLFGERIRYPKSWTIIAPSEAVFSDSLEVGLDSWSQSRLRDLARFLVIPDTVYYDGTDYSSFDQGVFVKPFSNKNYRTVGGTFMRKAGNTLYSSLYPDSIANIVDIVKGSNGVIYLVDDILYPVPASLTVFSQMLNYISQSASFIQEITNGQHSDMVTELRNQNGNLTFFIPTDQAIEAYNGIAAAHEKLKMWGDMSALERERLISNHIVRQRIMIEYQDGVGFYSNIGSRLDIYKIGGQIRVKGQNVSSEPARLININLQGSNGVIHFIDQVLIPEDEKL